MARYLKIVLAALGSMLALLIVAAAIITLPPFLSRKDLPAPTPTYIGPIGAEGSGPGRLNQPIGIAVSPGGEVFVSDAGNQRIAVFDGDGAFLRTFGQEGSGPGELDRPMHLSIGPDSLLYVAEYLNDRISVFRLDGSFVRHIVPDVLDAPGGVAVGRDGRIYIADFYNHAIRIVDGSGRVVQTLGIPGRIRKGALHYPTDLALAPDGSLWVADAYNHRLQRFVDSKATTIAGWGTFGLLFGFRVATGVGTDGIGRVYGADFGHDRIRVFDGDGTPLGAFGESGSGPGQLESPTDVAVHRNHVYVVDFGNDRVQLWQLNGQERRAP